MNILIVSPDGFLIDKQPGVEEALAAVETRASERMRSGLVVLAGMEARASLGRHGGRLVVGPAVPRAPGN